MRPFYCQPLLMTSCPSDSRATSAATVACSGSALPKKKPCRNPRRDDAGPASYRSFRRARG